MADLKVSMHSEHDCLLDKVTGRLTCINKNSLAVLRNRYNARTRKDRWIPFRQPKSYDEEFPIVGSRALGTAIAALLFGLAEVISFKRYLEVPPAFEGLGLRTGTREDAGCVMRND